MKSDPVLPRTRSDPALPRGASKGFRAGAALSPEVAKAQKGKAASSRRYCEKTSQGRCFRRYSQYCRCRIAADQRAPSQAWA